MLKLFKNLSISAKIAVGSAGTLLLAIVLAGAGWYGVQSLVGKIGSSQGLSDTLAKMNEASRTKALYIAQPNEQAAQEVRERLSAVQESLQANEDVSQTEQFEVARNAIEQFSASFTRLVQAMGNIRLRDAEIGTARSDIRDIGDAIGLDARLEEDNNRNALKSQEEITKRANTLAFEVSEVVAHAMRAQLALPSYLAGRETTTIDELTIVRRTTDRLFDSSVSPEVDAAAGELRAETDKAIALVKDMRESVAKDYPAATASIDRIIDGANKLKEAFFAFIKTSTAAQQKIEMETMKTRTKANIGQQFLREAMEVASDLNDYRAEPTEEKYEAIKQRIAKLNGLNGAVKAMTSRDATQTIETLTQSFEGVRASKQALEEALNVASRNESLASQTLNDLVAENKNDADRIASQAMITILAASVISLAFVVLLTFGLWYLISRPLNRFTQTTLRVAQGDHEVDLDSGGRKDEIGQLVNAMAVFRDNLIANERLEEEQKQARIEQGKRQQAVEMLISEFRTEMQDVLQAVSQNVDELQSTARDMTTLAEGNATRSASVADASQYASSNVDAVASAAEELASSIDEISRQAAIAMRTVETASGTASTANDKISQLATAAQTIGEVISLISDIANQTNLLALNATIEAARAGEAGKGFAVVAAEVKSLATQTSQATERIAAQIAGIQNETSDAVTAIGTITSTMDEVNKYTNAIAEAVSQQGGATSDISRNVLQAAERTRSVAGTIIEVNQSSTQTKDAADQVLTASRNVHEKAITLRSRVDRFLEDVAAA